MNIQDIFNALRAGHTDASRLLRLHTSEQLHPLMIERLEGVEAIGPGDVGESGTAQKVAGYRFQLLVVADSADLTAADFLGKPVLIELLTALSRTELRPFHGHITAFEQLHSDGGFSYYRLTVEPWLAFLGHRRDSFVFHDMTIIEIVENLFADYAGQGTLAPTWRWELKDTSVYRKRSTCTQFNESDLQFINRLLTAEGITYFIEHSGDSNSPSLGQHTVVFADHVGAFKPGAQPNVRFTRAAATESEDSVQEFNTSASWNTQSLEMASWDYRSLDTRSVAAWGSDAKGSGNGDTGLISWDTPGAYGWPDRETGERLAQCRLESENAAGCLILGKSTMRTFGTGNSFSLKDHFDFDITAATQAERPSNSFNILRVEHHARNNVGASLSEQFGQVLGQTLGLKPKQASTADADSGALYTNTFIVLPADTSYRARLKNDNGIELFPAPVLHTQTAIVVGESGDAVHTDRDGRIKIQFHWMRGKNSHSRLEHSSGDENAPADSGAWTWVRVMTQWAGNNWGSSFIPRVGQEVLVDFIEGDVDRPVVTGTAYNGQGASNAQNNQNSAGAGAATGNAPAWFAGENPKAGAAATDNSGPKHAHVATLAGIKTQAMTQSQQGAGGYNQMVFDLTPGEPRSQLATTQFASSLTLGANRHQSDNQRTAYRGHGAELVTGESGAVRAGSGLLISTDGRTNASGMQLDSRIAPDQLQAAQNLVTTLADSAQKQKADITGDPSPDKHPSVEALAKSQEIIAATDTGTAAGEQVQGGGGTAPAWSEPMLVAESPAGIAAVTPKDAVLVAGSTLTLAAADIHIASQGKQAWAVKDGIALYTYGKQSDTNRPVKDLGLKLHAAKGKVSVQAQSDKADFNADKAVTITSTTADVLLQGKSKLTVAAGGAGIEIAGGNITLTASGTIDLKGAQRNLTSAKSASGAAITLPAPADLDIPQPDSKPVPHSLRFAALGSDESMADAGLHELAYKVFDADGITVSQGTVPKTGHLPEIKTDKPERLVLQVGDANASKLEELPPSTSSDAASPESDEDYDDGNIDDDTASSAPQADKSRYFGEVHSAADKQYSQFLPESLIEQLLSEATGTKS
ncbi:MAG: hypothetical protein JWL63_1546 [Rhodocyclales bacterium]|nr:hypothetical protein [Rhodocyclales bacterium]